VIQDLPSTGEEKEDPQGPRMPWTQHRTKERREHRTRYRRPSRRQGHDRGSEGEQHAERLRSERGEKISVSRVTERRRHAARRTRKVRGRDPPARGKSELSVRSKSVRGRLQHPGGDQHGKRRESHDRTGHPSRCDGSSRCNRASPFGESIDPSRRSGRYSDGWSLAHPNRLPKRSPPRQNSA
jgi:hypothetical protein